MRIQPTFCRMLLLSIARRAIVRGSPVALLCCIAAGPACPEPLGREAPGESERLSAAAAVRIALEQSPEVRAARRRAEAAAAEARVAGARAPLLFEVAPGVGFTNGNALLSRELDVAGRRAAAFQAAAGEREAAEADLALTRLHVAGEARLAYFDLARARAAAAAAEEAAGLARQIAASVRRQVQAGIAPPVQSTRAEIEVARAEGDAARAGGDLRSHRAALNRLLGRDSARPLAPIDPLSLPVSPDIASESVERAIAARPDLRAARARLAARRGLLAVARARERPVLTAEMPADLWSLDREPFRSSDVGLQIRWSLPLFSRSARRARIEGALAGVQEQEAEIAAAARRAAVEAERALAELEAARVVARGYEERILPRSRELLDATRRGFETGLSSFLDVLEAQRTARQVQAEYLTALFDAVRASVHLERALGALPPGAEEPSR